YPSVIGHTYRLGPRTLTGPAGAELLFTNNETNMVRAFGASAKNRRPYVKDAFHRWVIHREACTNPAQVGTKAALHYTFPEVPPGGSVVVRLRLSEGKQPAPLAEVDKVVRLRKREADEFYAAIQPPKASADEKLVQRQALAGLLWTKQSYIFDVH